ncbi:MAG TPA: lysophospholipase [bacterium]|nr:lysophospholipase [bacterium]
MANIESKTGSFQNADKMQVFYRHWPVADAKAVVVICHGLGEHGDRYGNLVDRIVPAGYAAFAHDHRGHGKSAGLRGHVDSFDQFLNDVYRMIAMAREIYPEKRIFLLGHSMGGLIVLAYALRHPDTIDAVIASGAALKLAVEVPKLKATIGSLMAKIWPTLSLSNGLDPQQISHDPEVVRAYIADPLVHDRVTARFFQEFTATIDKTNLGAAALTMPLLMFHGGDDMICHPDGTRAFFELAGSKDKTCEIFNGQYHEVLNDLDKDKALDLIQRWLDEHVVG